ncbi:MAG: aromatic ring-hydroxylating dioxygenase subunit alpha [Proteobacteria bacterium]|nr:aromatic ring-hydroxylating dioxygenase subunit alpha [Pseudomonadota bacterium]
MQRPLPPSWYTDPAIHQREMADLFGRAWLPACHGSEVATAGSYVTLRCGGQEIALVRGRDGLLRAFHNACRHRAHRLLEGAGTLKAVITCPYHAWAYGLDGGLRHAPHSEAVTGFDRNDFGLRPLAVAEMAGFVMVNHDADAAPPDGFAGLEQRLLADFPGLPAMRPVRRRQADLAANWKLIVENYLECYHCDTAHPSFGNFDMTTWKHIVGQGWSRQGRVAQGSRDTDVGHDTIEGLSAWWQWPAVFWARALGPDSFVAAFHEPLGVDRTRQTRVVYTASGEESDELRTFNDLFDTVFAEDTSVVESVQRGLGSMGYRGGALVEQEAARAGWSEHGLHHFQDLIRETLGGNRAA